ncbi:MAG: hypothetical protein HGB02_06980 [Chlorobiaceae bacterium]|nr:hypothetical protein [Chlorobiaceae bacterium]
MNIHALFILVLLGLAGCTTTYKGSLKGTSNQDEQKRENYSASQSEARHSGTAQVK